MLEMVFDSQSNLGERLKSWFLPNIFYRPLKLSNSLVLLKVLHFMFDCIQNG